MAIIEELPDDHVEDSTPLPGPAPTGLEQLGSLDTLIAAAAERHFPGASQTSTDPNDPNAKTVPTLPPDVAAVKNLGADEFIRQLNKMPLFMTELDETGEDDKSPNEALDAIRALQYEGPAEEVANNFKMQGNEHFRAKHYKDARIFYTKALAVKELDREIMLQCLGNRAQCNLELGNYGKAIVDCRAALAHQPMNAKNWFRAARGLMEISRLEEAKECIANARKIEPAHRGIQEMEKKIEMRIETRDRKRRELEERERKKEEEQRKIEIAVTARGYATRGGYKRPDGRGFEFEDPGNISTMLTMPAAIVYYQEGADLSRVGQPGGPESDLIERVVECETIGDTVKQCISTPLPWDRRRDFVMMAGIEIYCETEKGGLVRATPKVSILELLGSGKVVVVDGVLALYVVPKRLSKDFVSAWKTQRMKQT